VDGSGQYEIRFTHNGSTSWDMACNDETFRWTSVSWHCSFRRLLFTNVDRHNIAHYAWLNHREVVINKNKLLLFVSVFDLAGRVTL
jgi:hypothetical protein